MPKLSNIQLVNIEVKKKRILRILESGKYLNLKELATELHIYSESFYERNGWRIALQELTEDKKTKEYDRSIIII